MFARARALVCTAPIQVGASGFMEVVKSGFYVDKTEYALILLQQYRAVLMRPPRMGKTLFLSMLMALFDTAYKKVFLELFHGLHVATEATPEQRAEFNSFHVLQITLPGTPGGNFATKIGNALKNGLSDFFERHPDIKHAVERSLGQLWLATPPIVVLGALADKPGSRLMVLVDEIDRAVMGLSLIHI